MCAHATCDLIWHLSNSIILGNRVTILQHCHCDRCKQFYIFASIITHQVTGLAGCTFIDKTREPPNSYQECRDVVTINEWTDRIYTNTPPEHIITNVVSGRKMRIQARQRMIMNSILSFHIFG